MTYYFKEDIYRDLEYVNKRLIEAHAFLSLQVVGGSALLLNDLHTVETEDIDTAIRLEEEIREILDDCGVDVNDDASEYDFRDYEFIMDNDAFSNISIQYLTTGGVIKSKLSYDDEEKAESLRYTMEEELGIEISFDGIADYLREEDIDVDEDDIEMFLTTIGLYDI